MAKTKQQAGRSKSAEAPVVTSDPRFGAGRKLVQQGKPGNGIEIFAILLEEARQKWDEGSIEVAPAYYEYGNALLRAGIRATSQADEAQDLEATATQEAERKEDARKAAADAAEKRLQSTVVGGLKVEEGKSIKKENATTKFENSEGKVAPEDKAEENGDANMVKVDPELNDGEKKETGNDADDLKAEVEGIKKDSGNEAREDKQEKVKADPSEDLVYAGKDLTSKTDTETQESSDIELALEMMENAFSILDEYQSSTKTSDLKYKKWVTDQIPRVLLGLGDCLSTLNQHADASDAYSRALEIYQANLASFAKDDKCIEHLQAHRRVCEATVLIAEELLACPPGVDIVTTETKALIVSKDERIEYTRGYYEKARDALQDAVVLMGSMAAKNVDVSAEKEDICFVSTLIMGVGMRLQEIEDNEDLQRKQGPPTKKQKI